MITGYRATRAGKLTPARRPPARSSPPDAGSPIKYLIRYRDGKFCALFDEVLTDAGVQVELTGVRMPRMNAVMERWVGTCRRELLDRSLRPSGLGAADVRQEVCQGVCQDVCQPDWRPFVTMGNDPDAQC